MRRLFLSLLLLSSLCAISWAADPAPANRPLTKEQVESMVQDQVDQALRVQRPNWEDRIETLFKENAGRIAEDVKKDVDYTLKQAQVENAKLEIKVEEAHKNLSYWVGTLSAIVGIVGLIITAFSLFATILASKYATSAKTLFDKAESINRNTENVMSSLSKLSPADMLTDEERQRINIAVEDANLPAIPRLVAKAYKAIDNKEWNSAATLWKALALFSGNNDIYLHNAAFSIAMLAETYEDSDEAKSRILYNESLEIIDGVLIKSPGDGDVLNNKGFCLMGLADLESGEKRDRLHNEAEIALLEAYKTRPGNASYNLACIAARRNDASTCMKWLKDAKLHGSFKCHDLQNDKDFKRLCTEKWFTQLKDELCPDAKDDNPPKPQ